MTAQAATTHPTRAQIIRLYALAHLAGLDHEGVRAEIWERYGVESTTELGGRAYEAYTRDLIIRARARSRAVEQTAADLVMHYPKIHDREGCARLLREGWPAVATGHPTLAGKLVEVMDAFRLCRLAGTISPRLLEAHVQRWQKLPLSLLEQAADIFLGGYTSRGERYFWGICRRLGHDVKREQRIAAAKAKQNAERDRAVERALEAILMVAGPRPVGAHGCAPDVVDGGCPCRAGRLLHHFPGAYRPTEIPCPWCDEGRALLRRALADSRYAEGIQQIKWQDVREQVEERMERDAAVQEMEGSRAT